MNNPITWADFEKIDIRAGTIIAVSDFPEANKSAFQLQIDFGEQIGVKKSSAQITELYDRTDLVGKQVLAVINFPAKQIANFMSECLVLGLTRDDGISLVSPDHLIENGMRLH